MLRVRLPELALELLLGGEELNPSIIEVVLLSFKALGLFPNALGRAGQALMHGVELRFPDGPLEGVIILGAKVSLLLNLRVIVIIFGIVIVPIIVINIVGTSLAIAEAFVGSLPLVVSGCGAIIVCVAVAGASIMTALASTFRGSSSLSFRGVYHVDVIAGGRSPCASILDGWW